MGTCPNSGRNSGCKKMVTVAAHDYDRSSCNRGVPKMRSPYAWRRKTQVPGMNIALDLDGVLADFVGGFRKLFGYVPEGAEFRISKEEWQRIESTKNFWRDLAPLPGAELLANIGPLDERFYIITSRSREKVGGDTRDWLSQRNIRVHFNNVWFANPRSEKLALLKHLSPAAFIDDSIYNVGLADKVRGVSAYLLLQPSTQLAATHFRDIRKTATVKGFLDHYLNGGLQ
jgi:hypothetical protein